MHLAWLIPILPLAAFLVIIFFGQNLKERSPYVGIAAIAGSFLVSCYAAVTWLAGHGKTGDFICNWAPYGSDMIRVGFSVDALTIMMLFVVTVVSMMVQIFSVGYMHGDKRFPRFFAYLSLFTCAMLSLVIANTLLLMYVSWELVGLTSYLLIGFWFEKPEAMRAAKKAFLVTRVGDVGFFLGLLLLYANVGSLELSKIFEHHTLIAMAAKEVSIPAIGAIAAIILGIFSYGFAAAALKGAKRLPIAIIAGVAVFAIVFALMHSLSVSLSIAAIAALLLFWGAMGKSAQFPLHVWLPDAMEGPTPVSALIHAATMVAAGVYLVARMYPVFHIDQRALMVVAAIGAFTALFAATMGLVMNDIKKVLAYSTISQLGYMMMALGVGGYTAGMFHLMTHAYFKANLFLGSGSVIHGTGTQDMRQMGGLRKKMPWTFLTFAIGTLALAGFPGFAGFFSKDEILLTAYHWEYGKIIFYAGLAGAFMTAFYMTRLVAMTFLGKPRDPSIHAHESWKVMLIPLFILAFLSIAAGYIGIPGHSIFGHYINPEVIGIEGMVEHHFSLVVMLLGTLAGIVGIGIASLIWIWPVLKFDWLKPSFGWVQTIVENKYYMDEINDIVVIKPLMFVNNAMYAFDRWVIDYAIVNGVGWFTLILSRFWSVFDKYVVDGLVNLVAETSKIGGRVLKFTQTGIVQQYAAITVICVILLSWYFLILR